MNEALEDELDLAYAVVLRARELTECMEGIDADQSGATIAEHVSGCLFELRVALMAYDELMRKQHAA